MWRLYGFAWETIIALGVFTCVWLADRLLFHRGALFVLGVGALLWLALRAGIELGWWALVRLIRWGQERVGPS
ncbi:MAG: hypothetical protein C0418_05605 [Coriobacteriaceae bacterium]|nr:hypothetical protein [Coriobacteriaceae bacterium]